MLSITEKPRKGCPRKSQLLESNNSGQTSFGKRGDLCACSFVHMYMHILGGGRGEWGDS